MDRMVRTVWYVYRAAVAEKADVYHFHDPELMPVGLLLRIRGRMVIYDVHEDNVTAIRQKSYMPRALRPLLAGLLGRVEIGLTRYFEVILAEKYYTKRFPGRTTVLNYPIPSCLPRVAVETTRKQSSLLFTGKVARLRGALVHAQIVAYLKDVEVHVVGFCSEDLASEMRQLAGDERDRLHIEGEGFYVPYDRILSYYAQGGWTAGLALFMPNPHDREKELTKLFEYMGAGIPIICSDFPVWRSLIEETGTGLCVDPLDPGAIAGAIEYLIAHPKEAEGMRQNGRRAVAERYNWDVEAQRLLSLYGRVTSQSRQAGSVAARGVS
jgi:glycosyltransferase involved in cell wall biosynthesis